MFLGQVQEGVPVLLQIFSFCATAVDQLPSLFSQGLPQQVDEVPTEPGDVTAA